MIRFLFLFFLIHSFSAVALQTPSSDVCKDTTTFTIATGKKGGGYYSFAKRLNKFLAEECILLEVISSNGSVDNLNRLKNNQVELAIIQSDVSHKTYRNDNFFSTVFPLFNEYVQLVARADSNTWFGDLKSQPILLGRKNSGTEVNAKDVLKITRLTSNIRNGDICEMLRGETVLAGFTTSKNIKHCQDFATENIIIPKQYLNQLVKQKPYYSVVNIDDPLITKPLLSIQAYLVIRNNFDKNKILKLQILVKILGENWDSLDKNMIPLSKALNKNIKPDIHPVSKKVLLKNNFVIDPSQEYWYLGAWLFLSIIIYFFNRDKDIYNRLGHYRSEKGIKIWSHFWFIKIVSYIQVLLIFLIIFSALTILIQVTEQNYDANSRFTNMSIWQLMMWVLTFMASGFTSDLYPSGNTAQIITTVLSLIGVFAPLFFIYQAVDKVQEKNKNERKGLLPIKLKNHIIICGWNEKVPGLIYSFTCNDAPEKKKIIVVAEMDAEYPLDKYEFDRKYVAYYRGDSADNSVLKNVSANKASAALIVAGNKKRGGKNITSVLSALALKKVNPNIFLSAELIYVNNRQYFESADVDVIFDFNVICNHLIVLATINPSVIDFLLDILTYDEFSEIYSMSVKEIKNEAKHKWLNKQFTKKTLSLLSKENTMGNAINEFLANGVNIIGFSQPNNRRKGVMNTSFKKDAYVFPVINVNEITGFSDSDILFYLADEKKDILSLKQESFSQNTMDVDFESTTKKKHNILIISQNVDRFKQIKSLYENMPFTMAVHLFGEIFKNDIINIDGLIEIIEKKEITHLIILTAVENKQQIVINDRGELDAVSVLVAKAIKNYNPNLFVISELINLNSKSMLENVGVNAVISQALFVERFFTKIVYNHGKVTDFLVGLLNVSDGQFLHIVNVQEGDLFIEKTYKEVWFNRCENARLIACLPIDRAGELKNKEEDFKTHFITNPKTLMNSKIKQGDQLVLIVDTNYSA